MCNRLIDKHKKRNRRLVMVKKIAALTLGRDCYSLTLDLAANVDVIENATKFIEEHKQKQRQMMN